MHWIPYGQNAVLLRFAEAPDEAAFQRSRAMLTELQRQPLPGLVEVTPAFTSMLLEFETAQAAEFKRQLHELLNRLERAVKVPATSTAIEIPVRYGGPDLTRVAEHSKLSEEEVVGLHAANIYRVHLLGFAPGFPYLGGLDARLHTPRLASPRPRVRAGSVAIGGEHTGIYTVDSPGGWNIIGHTDVKVFDPARGGSNGDDEAMFLLKAGDMVKFVPMK